MAFRHEHRPIRLIGSDPGPRDRRFPWPAPRRCKACGYEPRPWRAQKRETQADYADFAR